RTDGDRAEPSASTPKATCLDQKPFSGKACPLCGVKENYALFDGLLSNTKFRAFWNDESAEGPTIQELDEREAASARLKDVETCMDAFCKKNA
ncbi:MAG TPA: hypothetical protein VK138_10790, partial [Acidiferrobacterales bacterium]|nr:hypothetical protein [Acidiferrobacterales bacterium]